MYDSRDDHDTWTHGENWRDSKLQEYTFYRYYGRRGSSKLSKFEFTTIYTLDTWDYVTWFHRIYIILSSEFTVPIDIKEPAHQYPLREFED